MYACGDNDLENDIFYNVVQLQHVGSSDNINMVAQTDWWHHYGTAESMVTGEGVGRWYIVRNSDPTKIKSTLIETLPEINTGTAESVKDFVLWSIQHYPATHYMLIVGSHGSGWRTRRSIEAKGFGQDFTSDPSREALISLPDFKSILPSIYSALGNKKLDILAIDCCLNGAIEVAYQIKDYVDLLLASEETIPGSGYPWESIATDIVANPTWSGSTLATDIVNLYQTQYSGQEKTTLAAIDLSKITTVADRTKTLASLITANTLEANFRDLINQHTGQTYSIQRYHDVTFRDLWHMADNLISSWGSDPACADITIECATIKTAVEQAVILSKYTSGSTDIYSVANSHGLSIYLPTPQTTTYEAEYGDLDFSTYTGWGTFLQNFN
ncbi:MAG: clostripain-related cysteine peptidase [Candidatus Saganbacteria bacterium]|nr:clostripain-related cysteine peptidase [Candidatus Saganbacteria bacterium]